ncbi:MAG: BrnT family toxin [Xanthobacteraceae bacterium]
MRERGLDFDEAPEVFAGRYYQRRDDRRDYGETRIITVGFLRNRMVVLVWTPRGGDRHVISMRKANEREKARYGPHLETGRQRSEESG